MTRNFCLFAIVSFSVMGSGVISAQNTEQTPTPAVMQAVEEAFPENLRFVPAPPKGEGAPIQPYHSCAAVFHTAQNGTPDLLAVGYSGLGSELAMAAYREGKALVIDASPVLEKRLMAEDCETKVINLADPRARESLLANAIDVSFSNGPYWFFLWDGNKLQNITALVPGSAMPGYDIPARSAMYSDQVVDIDRDGPLQIVVPKGDGDKFPQDDGISATSTLTLFRYNGTIYAPGRTLLECREYEPNLPKTQDEQAFYKGDVGPWMSYIAMHKSPAPSYQLKIVNGDRDGSNRVTSTKVEIDGVTIVLPAEVNQSVETLTRTIQLEKENKIKVTVDGPSGSHIYVVIE